LLKIIDGIFDKPLSKERETRRIRERERERERHSYKERFYSNYYGYKESTC